MSGDSTPASAPPAGSFRSILFPSGEQPEARADPDYYRDLNLDQIVEAVESRRRGYDLRPYFTAPLRTADEVEYRHEVFRELEREDVRAAVAAFAGQARNVRVYLDLSRKQQYRLAKRRSLLDAADRYVRAVAELDDALSRLELGSRGLRALGDHLDAYTGSEDFRRLAADTRGVLEGLGRVRYTIRIKGNRVTVGPYEDQPDYTDEVESTFERFRREALEDRLSIPADTGTMDTVEAEIAKRVARLYPDEFAALEEFSKAHREFVDATVGRFEREAQFYLAWLEQLDELRGHDLSFCLPEVSDSKTVRAEDAFDLALAGKLAPQGANVVTNGFELSGEERILVVSGPNQGGKTTFARMFGQLHELARLGVPVPGRSARLFLADGLYTHFEREESVSSLHGKLDDELLRLREILDRATGDSVVVLNEIFSSTSLADAIELGSDVLTRLSELGCLAVCVTFVDELSSLDAATVSMVATVEPDDPSRRTFRVERRAADGRAYAWALAGKYGLSYERLKERVSR